MHVRTLLWENARGVYRIWCKEGEMAHELHLLVGDEHGLLSIASRDDGRTWGSPETAIPDVEACVIRRAPDGTVYVGTRGHGLWRSRDGQGGWEQVETPLGLEKVRSLFITRD